MSLLDYTTYRIRFLNADPTQGEIGEVLQSGTMTTNTGHPPTTEEIEAEAISGYGEFGLPAVKCTIQCSLEPMPE